MLVNIRRSLAIISVSAMPFIAPGALADDTLGKEVNEPGKEVDEVVNSAYHDAEADAKRLAEESVKRIEERFADPIAGADRKSEAAKKKAEEATDHISKGDNYHFVAGMERTDIKYDRPNITVTYQETHIPTVHVTMNMRSFAYFYPSTCVIGSTKILKSSLKWKIKPIGLGIRTKVPVVSTWWDLIDIRGPCLKTGEIRTKVPEFQTGQTTVKLPQVAVEWKTAKVNMHLPQFRIRDYPDQLDMAEDDLSKIKNDLNQKLTKISDEEKQRYKEEAATEAKNRFAQARVDIEVIFGNAKNKILDAIKVAEASRLEMEKEKNTDEAKLYLNGQIEILSGQIGIIDQQLADALQVLRDADSPLINS